MSILTMNLRHLYQRRMLWLAYPMLALFVWVSIMVALDDPEAGAGRFIGLIVLAFLVGMAAAVQQMEILSRPMAFCLPRHRQTVRRFVLTVGVVVNGAGALLFLLYPGLSILQWPAVLCSALAAGLVFYLVGVFLVFRLRQPMGYVFLLFLALVGSRLLGLHVLLERAVVMYPAAVIGFGGLSAAAMWYYLNDAGLARRSCLHPWIGFADIFDRDKLRRSPQARDAAPWAKLKDHPRPWVENTFIGGMARCRPLSAARCAWGAVYCLFAVTLSQWTSAIALAVLITLLLGYFRSHLMVVLFASLPIIAGAMHTSRGVLYSSMLAGGGRRERFYATLAVAVVGTGLLMLFMGVVMLLSIPLAAVIPEVRIYDQTIDYGTISPRVVYGPLVLLPVVATIHLAFYRRPVLTMVLMMALAYAAVLFGYAWRAELEPLISASNAALLALCCWLVFTAVAYTLARKRCLVR